MKDSSWENCIFNRSVRKVSSDVNRSRSLVETAHERIALIKEINKKNCNFVFEDYYTSLVELIQAMTFKEGFNVLNHICLGYFLRDFLKRDYLYEIFDDLRYKRNSLTYYGNRMDFETAQMSIEKCKMIISEIGNVGK